MTFDLDSPVGRRMVEAAKVWSKPWAKVWGCTHEALAREALAAALRVAEDDTCMTCGGKGHLRIAPPEDVKTFGENIVRSCTNPDCKNGHVTPPIYALLGILHFSDGELLALWQRATGGSSTNDPGHTAIKKLESEIERRERER